MEEETKTRPFGEDEIDLFELFLALKRRYKLILVVCLLSVAAAIALVYIMPPVYRVSASLSPGWLAFTENEKPIYIDSPENIQHAIKNGSFNRSIVEALGLEEDENYKDMQFNTELPRNSDIVRVSYETTEPAVGKEVVSQLIHELLKFYDERVETKKEKLDRSMHLLSNMVLKRVNDQEMIKNEKKELLNNIRLEKNKLAILENNEEFLNGRVGEVASNTEQIIAQRNELLKKGKEADAVALLMYSNTVQQNLSYLDRLNSQIEDNRIGQEKVKSEIEKLSADLNNKDVELKNKDAEINDVEQEIEKLQIEKREIEGVRIVQPPVVSSRPVKPKKKVYVAASGAMSLFVGMFLALFLEWWKRNTQASS